jgi:hypothetical protein
MEQGEKNLPKIPFDLFFSILLCCLSGDHTLVRLANVCYIQNKKVENIKHPLVCRQLWWFLGIFLI